MLSCFHTALVEFVFIILQRDLDIWCDTIYIWITNVRLALISVLAFHDIPLHQSTNDIRWKPFRKFHIKECFILLHFLSLSSISSFSCEGTDIAELVTSVGMSYWSVGLPQNKEPLGTMEHHTGELSSSRLIPTLDTLNIQIDTWLEEALQ